MKFKSSYLSILILIFVIFSITAVSASENQTATIATADDCISQDSSLMQENQIEDSNQKSLCTSIIDERNYSQGDIGNSGNAILQEDNDENSFVALNKQINQSDEELNIKHDYRFNESCDNSLMGTFGYPEIKINHAKLVINGLNHVIDGAGMGAKLSFENQGGEITINDLTFKNFNVTALSFMGTTILNNVTFTNCPGQVLGIIELSYSYLSLNNCRFNRIDAFSIIAESYSTVVINNSVFSGYGKGNAIGGNRGSLYILNSILENFTSDKGAIIDFKGDLICFANSTFANSYANTSGGAILAKYYPLNNGTARNPHYIPSDPILIQDCIFNNLTCTNDGGAIHIDLDSGSFNIPKTMIIEFSNFTNCSSRFGGAISILGGTLNIRECNFINNNASFKGGAIYSSWTNINITNSNFKSNTAANNGGALYFDKFKLLINGSNFTQNKAFGGSDATSNAIYAHDVELNFSNSIFDNGGVAVYADFASDSKVKNVEKNNDIFLMDNHKYIVSVENNGIKLNFTKNEIIVDTIPSRFDARDWGWTTPGKVQGDNDDCWAFATIASIETALAKSTGTYFNLSQNYAQKLQLKYSDVGDLRNSLTGFSYSGLGYALSWYGVLTTDGYYDDRGMIADADINTERIHVQDAMFIYTGMNDTIDLIKRAVLKYGAVSVQQWIDKPSGEIPTEGEDIAIMDHSTHFVSIIGWDDNYIEEYSKQKGGWIIKDSLVGFNNISYSNFSDWDYFAIVPQRVAIAYIFENDIDYHVNYQTDLTGLVGFDENYTYYSNEFTSKYSELIGAVGTYFNESGIDYSFDVYVNNVKVHSQTGISEFAGFRTIVLNKYIPVKTGDKFKVVFKNNALPYQAYSRQHYASEMSFISNDGKTWNDITLENRTVCLKVYTVKDDTTIINNRNITVNYKGGSYFSVKVVTSDGKAVGQGAAVKFTINGKTITAKTDANGIAKIKITQIPKKYTITTSYNGKTYKNTVTVKKTTPKITAKAKTFKKSVKTKKYTITLKTNLNKVMKKVKVTLKIKGKTYTAKTNSKGKATLK